MTERMTEERILKLRNMLAFPGVASTITANEILDALIHERKLVSKLQGEATLNIELGLRCAAAEVMRDQLKGELSRLRDAKSASKRPFESGSTVQVISPIAASESIEIGLIGKVVHSGHTDCQLCKGALPFCVIDIDGIRVIVEYPEYHLMDITQGELIA